MLNLRLFHISNPFEQLEARPFEEGELTIGRDPACGWALSDPSRSISRQHCVLERHDNRLTLRDRSANGVFLGAKRERPPVGQAVRIEPGETLRLGDYLIVVDAGPEPSADAGAGRPALLALTGVEPTLEAPVEWAAPASDAPRPTDGSLLDAFCEGARLDASAFAGEDPVEVMRRLGAVYQQMVLGLADLMNERTSVKAEYNLERTTVRAEGNNPFRWAPAQRVAIDLLRARDDGFLSGPGAVRVSFGDLKKHLLCVLSGARAAVSSALDQLSPETVENQVRGRSFLPGRGGAAWSEYARLHAEFARSAQTDPESPPNREFRAAYERRLHELDAMSTRG